MAGTWLATVEKFCVCTVCCSLLHGTVWHLFAKLEWPCRKKVQLFFFGGSSSCSARSNNNKRDMSDTSRAQRAHYVRHACIWFTALQLDRGKKVTVFFFFFGAFRDISHWLGGITPFGVFSYAFPGLKMWDTFACATAIFLSHFIISIAVLENVPPDTGLQKRATFPH
jgi:hypothetical protein